MAATDSNPTPTTEQPAPAYRIVVTGDLVEVIDRTGSLVKEGDLWMVSDLLRDAKRQLRQRSEDEAALSLEWDFPTSRYACFGIQRCVYAIMPTGRDYTVNVPAELQPHWPNVIKIGYTATSLMSRRTSLDAVFGGGLVVYAYAECDQPNRAEAGLHRVLAEWRITGEWFHRDYVMGFLEAGGVP